jgi:hypothetical protein
MTEEDEVEELPNGCESVRKELPESWWLGSAPVLCGCGQRVRTVYPFAKVNADGTRSLFVRFRHAGFGFCETEAVSNDVRELRKRARR